MKLDDGIKHAGEGCFYCLKPNKKKRNCCTQLASRFGVSFVSVHLSELWFFLLCLFLLNFAKSVLELER